MDFPIIFCCGASDGGFAPIDHSSNYCCDNLDHGLNYAFECRSGICWDLAGLAWIDLDKTMKRPFLLEIDMRTKSFV